MKKLLYSLVFILNGVVSASDIEVYSENNKIFDSFYCIGEFRCENGYVLYLHNNITDECCVAYDSFLLDRHPKIAYPIQDLLVQWRKSEALVCSDFAVFSSDSTNVFDVTYAKNNQDGRIVLKKYLDKYYKSKFLVKNYKNIEAGFGAETFFSSNRLKNCIIVSKKYQNLGSNFNGSEYELDLEVMRLASLGENKSINYKDNQIKIISSTLLDIDQNNIETFRNSTKVFHVFTNGLTIEIDFD